MKAIAKLLVQSKVINLNFINKYTWSSGVISPIYIDNRLIFSCLAERKIILNALANLIKDKFPNATFLVGVATASIGHAAVASYILNLRSGYVRPSKKIHGTKRNIEGKIQDNDKIVIVEDVIATGTSVLQVVDILHNSGFEVVGIVSIFNYLTNKSKKNLYDYPVFSLTNIYEVMDQALAENRINEADIKQLNDFLSEL